MPLPVAPLKIPAEPPAPPAAPTVAAASVRGGVYSFAAQGVQVGTHLASIVILARLLSPNDYGTIAMVYSITAFAGLFRDLGLSTASIQRGTLSQGQMTNLFWVNMGMGAALTLSLCAAAPLIAWFFQRPELVALSMVLSVNFLLASIGTQHNALLQRSLRFDRRALALISGSLATFATSITLAYWGYSYWSLAWGTLAGTAMSSLLLFALSPFRPGWWCKEAELRSLLKLGANVTAFEFVNYFSRNLDNVIVGRVLGAEALGFYNRAYQLLMFPITNLRNPVTVVAYPALSRLQFQPAEFRRYYVQTTTLIALLTMPVTAFLYVIAKPLVLVALGEPWLPIVPIFTLLAFAAFIQPSSGFAGSLLLSLGRGDRYLRCGLFSCAAACTSFVIGVRWGAEGVALAYSIANYAVLLPYLYWAFKDSPVSVADFFRACAFPATLALASATVTFFILRWAPQVSPLASLVQSAAVFWGSSLALSASHPTGRSWLRQGLGLLRRKRRTKSNPLSPSR